MESSVAESQMKTLDKFCKNLTELASKGKLDPVIGGMRKSGELYRASPFAAGQKTTPC